MIRLIPLVVFAAFCFLSTDSLAQHPVAGSGFYVMMRVKKNCPNSVATPDGTKTYCLPSEPVIGESDFESVGEVQYDSISKVKYLILNLTANGAKSFKFLGARLPDSKLVFVVEGQVAGVFDDLDKDFRGRSIQIRGSNNTIAIDWIYDRLKKTKQ